MDVRACECLSQKFLLSIKKSIDVIGIPLKQVEQGEF